MGVGCGQMNEQYAEYYGLEPGLVVQSFSSDSPAKAAGLQLDDVITSANGIRVKTFDELFAIMQKMKPGDEMKLECYRLVRSEENIWGFKASEPFTITFTMQAKHEDTSSTPSTPSYPGA
jgi:S1-C subfamily serine protease